MAKKPKKKSEKQQSAGLESQLKETVLKAPKAREPQTTMISAPKAKSAKNTATTLVSPARASKSDPVAASSRFTRLKSSLRFKNESSLAPSFLSTKNPHRTSFPWDPVKKVQAIILAVFLLVGGGLYIFADTLHGFYDKSLNKMSSAFDWRMWSAEVFTQTNEPAPLRNDSPSLLPSREIIRDEAAIQPAMVPPASSQGFDDVIPKESEPKKKASIQKEPNRNKSALTKKSSGKKKEVNAKKSSKRKLANKATKGKKSH